MLPVDAQTCTSPPSSLLSWWPGDDDANDIQNGNHGTLQNGAIFNGGKVGKAFSFDGMDDFVEVSDAPFDITSQIAIDFWFYLVSPPPPYTTGVNAGYGGLVSKWWDGSTRAYDTYVVSVYEQNQLVSLKLVGALGPTSDQDFVEVPISAGQWYHAAFTYDGSQMKLYLNGVLVDTHSRSGNIPTNNAKLTFGKEAHTDPFIYALNGLIDEIEIFNRALSASEILAIFNADSMGKCKVTNPDTIPPVITLLGDNPASAECGSSYNDAGATAHDDTDGDITSSIVVGGLPIDTGVPAASSVTYDVSDAAGNAAATATRTVNVVDTTAPTVTATLVPFGNGGDDDEGKFIVSISATDSCGPLPAVTANLNGVPVTNGQPVKLEIDDEAESKFNKSKDKQCAQAQKQADKKIAKGKPIGDELAWKLLVCEAGGVLQMEDVSFTLTATATDTSGNSASATVSPTFVDEDD